MSFVGIGRHTFVNCSHLTGAFQKDSVNLLFLYEALCGYEKVIALGVHASSVLKNMGVEHFKMPHPSGRNRQLNDPAFEKHKLRALKKWLDG